MGIDSAAGLTALTAVNELFISRHTDTVVFAFLFAAAVLSGIAAAVMYVRTAKILKRLDEMLEGAICHTFTEYDFTETKLSRLESKMYRFLSAEKTVRKQREEEKNGVKALVSDISHQTKLPVSNILLYTQLLKEREELDDSLRGILCQIESQAEKLAFLISSLVKTSRLENGIVAVRQKENSIRQLVEGLDGTAAKQKGLLFTVEEIPDCMALFDRKWTEEALGNILDNAVKYTPEGGSVRISAKEYEMFVRIEIADTGIGIREEETAEIFRRFYRSPEVGDEKGVGIGLYLAREIITKEGGYLKVDSKLGEGSVFSVFLQKTANLSILKDFGKNPERFV